MNRSKIIIIVLCTLLTVESVIIATEWHNNFEAELTDDDLMFLQESQWVQVKEKSKKPYISIDTAIVALEKFKKKEGIFHREKKRAYGHLFHLDTLRHFIERIDIFNNNLDSLDNKKIEGVRVYRSRNEYSIGRTNELIKYDDIFLIPTLTNKQNLYDVDPDYPTNFEKVKEQFLAEFPNKMNVLKVYLSDSSLILNTSAPCPNNCEPEK